MKLICTHRYRNRGVDYAPGAILDLAADEAAALLADSPGSFEPYAPPKAMDAPPIDKMVRNPRRKKDA
jgi:hypothetical protein